MSAEEILDLGPRTARRCPNCGELWPLFTAHACPEDEPETKHAEHLCDLLQSTIQDLDVHVKVGGYPQSEIQLEALLAGALSMALADRLVTLRIRLLNALVADDVIEPAPRIAGHWRLTDD